MTPHRSKTKLPRGHRAGGAGGADARRRDSDKGAGQGPGGALAGAGEGAGGGAFAELDKAAAGDVSVALARRGDGPRRAGEVPEWLKAAVC